MLWFIIFCSIGFVAGVYCIINYIDDGRHYHWEFHVPKGTVKQGYNIDAK